MNTSLNSHKLSEIVGYITLGFLALLLGLGAYLASEPEEEYKEVSKKEIIESWKELRKCIDASKEIDNHSTLEL